MTSEGYASNCSVLPRELTILTTSECDAHCAHCLMRSGPKRHDTLTLANIVETVEAAHAANPLQNVVFAGGEPTLLKDLLLDAIAHVSALGICTRVVTNAGWAATPEQARDMVSTLREAGLDEVNYSADDFHLPWIPLENVVNAWQASKGVGFLSVVIALSSGPASKVTPKSMMAALGEEVPLVYDVDGRMQQFPPPAPDGTCYLISNTQVYRIGRGRRLRQAYALFPTDTAALDGPCPWAIDSAALSAKNHLVACCGIEAEDNLVLDFGHRDEESVPDLVAKANDDPLVLAISALGPSYLMKLAKELDPSLSFRPRYSAICEICEDVTSNAQAVEVLRANADVIKADMASSRITRLLVGAMAAQQQDGA
jgi:hypothetical protein